MDFGFTIKYSLIAPCGMNCGICIGHLRKKNNCTGCNNPGLLRASCANCVIKNCEELKKKNSKFCCDCEKYPCRRLKQLDKRYRTKYFMSMIDNLNFIKESGIREFFKKEKVRWACSKCGGTLCVHNGLCSQCKSSFRKITKNPLKF